MIARLLSTWAARHLSRQRRKPVTQRERFNARARQMRAEMGMPDHHALRIHT